MWTKAAFAGDKPAGGFLALPSKARKEFTPVLTVVKPHLRVLQLAFHLFAWYE